MRAIKWKSKKSNMRKKMRQKNIYENTHTHKRKKNIRLIYLEEKHYENNNKKKKKALEQKLNTQFKSTTVAG